LLGKFKEPERYPSGFEEMFLKKGCKTWNCLTRKAAKKMSTIFRRSEKYNLKYPGNQIRGMALYEIFYLNTLKKNEKKINEFIENWPKKNKNAKQVINMVRLNKSREKMRSALGMDLNTPVEDALEVYWIMGEFLDLGVVKKQKISRDLKSRKKFLTEYKNTISKFNSEFKKNKDKFLYDSIKGED
jgi:cysteinyl-tRNA synthetase